MKQAVSTNDLRSRQICPSNRLDPIELRAWGPPTPLLIAERRSAGGGAKRGGPYRAVPKPPLDRCLPQRIWRIGAQRFWLVKFDASEMTPHDKLPQHVCLFHVLSYVNGLHE